MTLDQFTATLEEDAPPQNVTLLLQALWFEANGDWNKAHDLAQEVESADSSWVHAYLHRKDGDLGNAAYWYQQAGKPVCKKSLHDEWEEIVSAFLS
ncbi:MAG TPA: hypothetical protein PLJ60_10830 [Chryseolinea sp.]|nr:hypothetical protein [Flavobacteriales bacterium]HPM30816.1 hypothetical protein [Chryseolinea sp.]